MGTIQVRVLTEKEIQAVHTNTMRILSDTGLKVHHAEALELLRTIIKLQEQLDAQTRQRHKQKLLED